MPALKKKRSNSVRDLIMGKKKKERKAAEAGDEVDGEVGEQEEAATTEAEATTPEAATNGDAAEPEMAEDGEQENHVQEKKDEENAAEAEEPVAAPEPETAPEETESPDAASPESAGDEPSGVDLKTVVSKLESFAPLSLAEDWDNVGLLVEPSSPNEVKKIFLTNDLTEEVLDEAINAGSNFILSYHPPIFSPLKRLTMKSEKERIIIKAIEKSIAVYSPHTAHDAVKGGVNDWLISAFGDQKGSPITTGNESGKVKLEVSVAKQFKLKTQELFTADNGSVSKVVKSSDSTYHFNAICDESTLNKILRSLNSRGVKRLTTFITKYSPDPCGETGCGRFVNLDESISLGDAITKVKEHLSLEHVQLAMGSGQTLESPVDIVAVCAGSGSKVLSGTRADLYLTGEMSHHELLEAVSKGTNVILCNHSNTERGFLKEFKSKLEGWFGDDVTIQISEVDADPLKVV